MSKATVTRQWAIRYGIRRTRQTASITPAGRIAVVLERIRQAKKGK